MGSIQNIEMDSSHGAYVLPANTSFDEGCIRDPRSSLGAFFQKYFPSGLNSIQENIRKEAQSMYGEYFEKKGECPAGTTIFLDKPLGSNHRIFITAVTKSSFEGIHADTLTLIASIKKVFQCSADKRISELCFPVLGTGHGGLDFPAALTFMILQSIHCVISEGAHHVKYIKIVVYDPKKEKQAIIKRIVESTGQICRR
jgi:O-acetyl-ADP-ribose deacetylase (regulator of RNase III)